MLSKPAWDWSVAFETSLLNASKDLFWRVWLIISVFNLQLFVEIVLMFTKVLQREITGRHRSTTSCRLQGVKSCCMLFDSSKKGEMCSDKPTAQKLIWSGKDQCSFVIEDGFPFHVMQRHCFFRWEDIDRRRNVGNEQAENYVSGQQDLSARFADELFLLFCILHYERLRLFYCCC